LAMLSMCSHPDVFSYSWLSECSARNLSSRSNKARPRRHGMTQLLCLVSFVPPSACLIDPLQVAKDERKRDLQRMARVVAVLMRIGVRAVLYLDHCEQFTRVNSQLYRNDSPTCASRPSLSFRS
jgi:hypothetical protein